MEPCFSPTPGVVVLPSFEPVPGIGVLPVQSFLLRGEAPTLVDTGLAKEQGAFLEALDTLVDLADLRYVLLTHEDGDHAGALFEVLRRAPCAELITTAVGVGKLSALGALPLPRVRVVEPGGTVTLGDHTFTAHRPPMYDSPATLAFQEREHGWLFTSDGFGAFVPELTERGEAIRLDDALDGMAAFCGANSPWLADVSRAAYDRRLAAWARLDPSWVFASHLAPLAGSSFAPYLARARALAGGV